MTRDSFLLKPFIKRNVFHLRTSERLFRVGDPTSRQITLTACCSYYETRSVLIALAITVGVCFAISVFAIQVRVSDISTDTMQGRRQVKICGVDRHGERGARAYNGGLESEL